MSLSLALSDERLELSPVAKILLNLIFLGKGMGRGLVVNGVMKETQWIFNGFIF